MKALEFIAQELEADGFIAKFERDGSLSLGYGFEPLDFEVTNELDSIGLFVVSVFAGRDRETNAHDYENDFACPTALGTLNRIRSEVRNYLDSTI